MAVIISAFNKWKFFYAANYECYVFLCVCLFKVLLESSECFQPGKNTIKFTTLYGMTESSWGRSHKKVTQT